MQGLFRYVLQDIPMLGQLAVLEAEDVHDRHASLTGHPNGVDVSGHVVALGDKAFDLHRQCRERLLQERQPLLETGHAVGDQGIVLETEQL